MSSYLDFIHMQDCVVCGRWPVDAHHAGLRCEHHVGMGQKAPDSTALPLCHEHHMEWHDHGRMEFENKHRVDIPNLIKAFNEQWHKE